MSARHSETMFLTQLILSKGLFLMLNNCFFFQKNIDFLNQLILQNFKGDFYGALWHELCEL